MRIGTFTLSKYRLKRLHVWKRSGPKKITMTGVLRLAAGTCFIMLYSCLIVQKRIGISTRVLTMIALNSVNSPLYCSRLSVRPFVTRSSLSRLITS